jgi:hypothetical protein
MLVMLGEQPACYGQRSCIHDHGELAETTVGSLDTADGKYSSVTFGSIQAMLTSPLSMGHGDWSVGSSAGFLVAPGPGADRSPAAGFMSGQPLAAKLSCRIPGQSPMMQPGNPSSLEQ